MLYTPSVTLGPDLAIAPSNASSAWIQYSLIKHFLALIYFVNQ
jgi:hypothetical protein